MTARRSSRRTCITCGRREPFEPKYTRGGFTLVRCPGCGLVFQDPQPTVAEMDAYYFSDAFARRLEGDLRQITVANAHRKLPLLRRAGVRPAGPALDVGCATGAWLEAARVEGWHPVGVEIGGAMAAAARARGFEVFSGEFAAIEHELADRRFKLITFWDVLEHLPDPLAALEAARRLLAPGGSIAMTFPNVEGWFPRLTYRLLARTTGVWEYPELPVHLYDFSPATAARLLRRAALEPVVQRTTAVPFDFYRETTLGDQLAVRGRSARPLQAAFEALHAVVYPLARVANRGNAQFALARPR